MDIWLGRGGLLSGIGVLVMLVWALLTHQAPHIVWILGFAAIAFIGVNLWGLWRR
jgi:hypothetical protein